MAAAPGFEPGSEATPDGYIAQDLSANGTHFIFGSTAQFAQGGNSGGPVSIYDRDLSTEETQVVSNAPAGGPLPCLQNTAQGECHAPKDSNGIAELAVSSDGSRILIGQKVSEDADHNVYYRLYMDIDDSPETIELTPGASDGVLFNGMTSNGSEVFFTTKDKLTTATNQDTDESADLYQAEVSESGATLNRISTGTEGTGNTDACEPAPNKNGAHWNSLEATANCGVLAIGGGGGVAAKSGADLLPLPRAPRWLRKRHPKPAQPLPRRPRAVSPLHRHPQPRRPPGDRLLKGIRNPPTLPTSRSPPTAASRSSPRSSPSPAMPTAPTPRSSATAQAKKSLPAPPVIRPTPKPPGTPASPKTVSASPNRARSSSTKPTPSSPMRLTKPKMSMSGSKRNRQLQLRKPQLQQGLRDLHRPDLHRHQPLRIEPPLRLGQRHRRLLLHPRRPRPPGSKRRAGQDL